MLTTEELSEFTGSKTSKKQIKMLVDHGIKFVIRTDGKIRTTWAAIDSVLIQKAKDDGPEPDFSALRKNG